MPRIPPELSASQYSMGDDSLGRLGQVSAISEIDGLGCGEWTVLYEFQNDSSGSRCFYSALLPNACVADALKHDNWDLTIGFGAPGFSQRRTDGVDVVEYDRFGSDGVEPVVYSRDFHGIKPRQFDLSEEFRLLHNLYHDRHNDRYVHIDNRGNETIVAEVSNGRVRVLTRFVRQYMAARQLALALFFEQPDEKSISKFERYLENHQYPSTDRDIGLLRTLQDLRSSGAAHAKGKNFDKIRKKVGLDVGSPKDVFRSLLVRVNQMLDHLISHFIPETE